MTRRRYKIGRNVRKYYDRIVIPPKGIDPALNGYGWMIFNGFFCQARAHGISIESAVNQANREALKIPCCIRNRKEQQCPKLSKP